MTENGSSSVQILSVDVFGGSRTGEPFNVAAGLVQAGNNAANSHQRQLGATATAAC